MFGGISIVQLIMGSWVMWILMVLAVAAIAFILERGYAVQKWKSGNRKFKKSEIDKLKERIRQEGVNERLRSQIAKYRGPLPVLARDFIAVMTDYKKRGVSISHENIDKELDISMERTRSKMEGKMTILGTISNISPLIGLLGTVLGIMRSFAEIAVTGSGGASVIAMGVAEALGTTVVGIMIAVPCTIAYNYYFQQVEMACSDADLERMGLWLAQEEFEQLGQGKSEE